MKNIDNLNGLQQYGINILTGEADRLSMRLLCDLNEDGRKLVADFYGLPFDVALSDNWNSSVNGQPATASIMLTRNTLWELARFALLSIDNVDVVIETPGWGVRGGDYDEPHTAHYLAMAEHHESKALIFRNHSKGSSAPGAGTRNTHAMSGRTA